MNPSNDKHERLEKYVDSVLRAQPPKRAPASLEMNVLAAIRQRAARQWWQQGFGAWPIAAKVVFFICSVGFAKVALMLVDWGTSPLDTASSAQIPQSVAWVHTLSVALTAVFKLIPNFWVYATLGVLGAMYVLLFGVSAAAYRTLYAPR